MSRRMRSAFAGGRRAGWCVRDRDVDPAAVVVGDLVLRGPIGEHDPLTVDERGHEVLRWNTQREDFEADGSLRDISVLDTTVNDWRMVLTRLLEPPYRARLERAGATIAVPVDVAPLFATGEFTLRVTAGTVELVGHFFSTTEIELDFVRNDLTEAKLETLLELMVALGTATQKRVVMTPEGQIERPTFSFDPAADRLKYFARALASRAS